MNSSFQIRHLAFSAVMLVLLSVPVHSQTFDWAATFGSAYVDQSNGMAIDSSGNIYTAGVITPPFIDFDPGDGTFIPDSTVPGYAPAYLQKLDRNGDFQWVTFFGPDSITNNKNTHIRSLAVDGEGNVYAAGNYGIGLPDSVSFYLGSETRKVYYHGGGDFFVMKCSPEGELLWFHAFGGREYDVARAIAFDPDGYVIVAGLYRDSVDFDSEPQSSLPLVLSNIYDDGFLLKLDRDGNTMWVRSIGGSESFNVPDAMLMGPDNSIYLAGRFYGTIDADPGLSREELSTPNGTDIFLTHYSGEGELIWARSIAGDDNVTEERTPTTEPLGLAVDGENNLFMITWIIGQVDVDPGPDEQIIYSNKNSDGEDIPTAYLLMLDPNGEYLNDWKLEGNGPTYGFGVALDSQDNLYLTGRFTAKGSDVVDFDPGDGTFELHSTQRGSDAFILKLDPAGNYIWVGTFANAQGSYPVTLNNIAFDPLGFFSVSGTYSGTVDFDPSSGAVQRKANGGRNVFILQFSTPISSVNSPMVGTSLSVPSYRPVPVRELLYADWKGSAVNGQLQIFDLTGRMVAETEWHSSSGTSIDLSSLPSGPYIVRTTIDGREFSTRIIKE